MKLLFFSNTLKGGGAERVLVNITTELARRGHDVTIALNHNDSNYAVPSQIKIVGASEKNWYKGRNILKRIIRNIQINRYYTRFTHDTIHMVQPDVIITFLQCNMGAIIKHHGTIPIIHSEHNAYDRKLGLRKYINRFYLNKKFDKVFILTPFDYGYACAKGLKNTVVMPNPNTYESISYEEYENLFPNRKNILACGRVNQWEVKGFDIAIKAFARIANQIPHVDFDIAGAGDKRNVQYLLKIASKYGVDDRIHFLGQRGDIQELMQNHQLFLLSSRTEGFPMVITEAMTQGLPCVAFERLATSIIIDGIDGVLVENGNIEYFAYAILSLLEDNKKRFNLGLEAIKNVRRFSASTIANRWETTFSLNTISN